jgi:DNA topoisomerase II
MQRDLDKLSNQARFIKMIIDRELNISKKKKAVLITELKKLNFKPFAKIEDATKDGEIAPVVDDDAENDDGDDEIALASSSYDYLLGVCTLPLITMHFLLLN